MNESQEIKRHLQQLGRRMGELEQAFGKLKLPNSRGARFPACLVKVTDTYREPGGSGGKYVGFVIAFSESTAKLAGNLTMPEGLTISGTDETCLAMNLSETGRTGHAVDTTNAVWFIGLVVGRTTKAGNTPPGLPIVVFDRRADELFPVNVTQTGGSAGNQTSPCTFTYSVTPVRGGAAVPGLSPAYQRPNGKMIAATHGTAYIDNTGTLVLWDVDEVRDTAACSPPPPP